MIPCSRFSFRLLILITVLLKVCHVDADISRTPRISTRPLVGGVYGSRFNNFTTSPSQFTEILTEEEFSTSQLSTEVQQRRLNEAAVSSAPISRFTTTLDQAKQPVYHDELLFEESDGSTRRLTPEDVGKSSSDFHFGAPLLHSDGVHYGFIWVGTPMQRVSVILDTGSHHTAFPCNGCNCGKHMSNYFSPYNSTTALIRRCDRRVLKSKAEDGEDKETTKNTLSRSTSVSRALESENFVPASQVSPALASSVGSGSRCFFSQSYTEGSSWSAYAVADMVIMGTKDGPANELLQDASVSASERFRNGVIPFQFGCISKETGLFRTQKIDGIMGLSSSRESLPYQLHRAKVTNSKMFSMCLLRNAGVMSLGGMDPRLPYVKLSDGQIYRTEYQFVQLVRSSGWFTVYVEDLFLSTSLGSSSKSSSRSGSRQGPAHEFHSLGVPINLFNAGKGTILDTGTTDTYFPSTLYSPFVKLWKRITGRSFSNHVQVFSSEQLRALPTVVVRLRGAENIGTVDLHIRPNEYLQSVGNDRYVIRIYLTESGGAVLGANAMMAHDFVFDPDSKRVGIARSSCTLFDDESLKNAHDLRNLTVVQQLNTSANRRNTLETESVRQPRLRSMEAVAELKNLAPVENHNLLLMLDSSYNLVEEESKQKLLSNIWYESLITNLFPTR